MPRNIVLENTVHLSSRYANSSTNPPIGVRFSKNHTVPDLPYVTVQGTLTENPALWSTMLDVTIGQTSKSTNQAEVDLLLKECRHFFKDKDIKSGHKKIIDPITPVEQTKLYSQHISYGNEPLDYRVKQIFLPFNGDYISATPLESAGFSLVIKELLEYLATVHMMESHEVPTKEKITKSTYNKFFYAHHKCRGISVGGTNSQNVSLMCAKHVMEHTGMFYGAPIMDAAIRQAMRLMSKDMYIKTDYSATKDLEEWLASDIGFLSTKLPNKVKKNILKAKLRAMLQPFLKETAEMRKREYDQLTPFNRLVYNQNSKELAVEVFQKIGSKFGVISTGASNQIIEQMENLI